jgi:uncharacterized UPF0146 family protein
MWSDFSRYIIGNYARASKIVEVGVGTFPRVARDLKEHLNLNIVMTDIKPSHEGIIQDDICHPHLKIYDGAELIYSIRPPEELHPCLVKVAELAGSDLIIKTLSTDVINSKRKFKLINYEKAVFYKMI